MGQGICMKCRKLVYHQHGFKEYDLCMDETPCPITGCGGFFEVSNVIFWRCQFYAEYQKKIDGVLCPKGKGNTEKQREKSTSGDDIEKHIDEGRESMCHYT